MKAVTALDLLLLAERARFSEKREFRDEALDTIRNTLAGALREILQPAKDPCSECGGENCHALWKHGKKCCPDCTHQAPT